MKAPRVTRVTQRAVAAWQSFASLGTANPLPMPKPQTPSKPRAKQAAPERDVMQAVRHWARLVGLTLLRNNCGQYEAAPGRWVRYGLGVGSSDLIGYRTLTITADMVGKQIAQFAAVELKAPGKKPTPEQQLFIDDVRKAGGVAGVAHGVDEAREIFT